MSLAKSFFDEIKGWKQMSYRLLHRIVKGASAAENYTKEYTEIWELDSIQDFNPLMFATKRKNSFVAEWSGETISYFVIESANLTKRQPMPGGRLQVEIAYRMRHVEDLSEIQPPWSLPAYNFRISSALNEESSSQFYPGDDDIWLNEDDSPFPFVNTAGVMLEGSTTYTTAQISFSYAISAVTFSMIQDWFWTLPGKINCDRVTICGMTFPPRTIKIDSMNAEYSELEAPGTTYSRTTVENGETITRQYEVGPVNYHYYRVDVTLSANPRTWNQYFLNVGTHVNRGGVIARLWSWDDKNHAGMAFGTYGDYVTQEGLNGQAISEPVALNADGTNASGLGSDGRQLMTYRHGSMFEPISFQALAFPAGLPKKWSQG